MPNYVDVNANLNVLPVPGKAQENFDYMMGDLHANAVLMIYFLHKEGILSLSEEEYESIKKIYHMPIGKIKIPLLEQDLEEIEEEVAILKTKDLENYKNILQKAHFNKINKIHFIGDTIADRGNGDHFILYNYQALAEHHIDYDIVLSNHDLEFIVAYWTGKKLNNTGDLSTIYDSHINHTGLVNSTLATLEMIENGLIDQKEILDLFEKHYLPKLNLISYTLTPDGITLMTHAPIDFTLIESAATELGISYKDDTPQALASTIDAINKEFQKQYIQTGAIVDLGVHNNQIVNQTATDGQINSTFIAHLNKTDRLAYIIDALTWNRPNPDIPLKRPSNHRGYSIHYVHGHTPTKNDPNHVTNLDSLFGKNEKVYTSESQKLAKKNGYEGNIGYRSLSCESSPWIIPEAKFQQDLSNIESICNKLSARYDLKIINSTEGNSEHLHYKNKKGIIDEMLTVINNEDKPSEKIKQIHELYDNNNSKLEVEFDHINKNLLKVLKGLLVGAGLVLGVVPGLIALGIFAKSAHDKTGSANFLSKEALKTSKATELKKYIGKI